MIQVLALTDGDRDKFAESVSSFKKNLRTSLRMQWVVYNAGGDEDFREWAKENFPWLSEIYVGYGKFQQRAAWAEMDANIDYVIQFGDGQTLDSEYDVDTAIGFIDDHPYLAQLVIGDRGVTGDLVRDVRNRHWTVHKDGWSMLPCIYRRAVTDLGWPIGRAPHERFTTKLQRNSNSWKYAYMPLGS